ncbi:DNA primase domain containing protein [Aphelenchoides besseyi]|nr:DNA primase domain containing protein [Aphelenchoides besseyi]KAI6211588.1 DNA primase domain containing protein [Aphelenchoides besseyi]
MNIRKTVAHSFTVYGLQAAGFDYQQKHPDSRLFSFEAPEFKVGGRKFICTPLDKFYNFYNKPESPKHFYEIIQADRSCRPYFDLEFDQKLNPNVDGIQLVHEFVSICQKVFKQMLGLEVKEERFLILDSTSQKKFSAHVIVHLPEDRLLSSNAQMKFLLLGISEEMERTKKCWLDNERNDRQSFYDPSVYSKNRNFRLVFSSKCGKPEILKYADYCKFYGDNKDPDFETLFYDSLIMPKDYDKHLLIDVQRLESKAAAIQRKEHVGSGGGIEQFLRPIQNTNTRVKDLCVSFGPSKFPDLDQHVLAFVRQQVSAAVIRKTTLSFLSSFCRRQIQYEVRGGINGRTLSFQFHNCRFCWNKRREHKRQNVYWIVNLETFEMFQRCFDPECRNFVSESFPIPEEVQKKTLETRDDVFSQYGVATTVEKEGIVCSQPPTMRKETIENTEIGTLNKNDANQLTDSTNQQSSIRRHENSAPKRPMASNQPLKTELTQSTQKEVLIEDSDSDIEIIEVVQVKKRRL